jgi:hypothetical protein
MGNLNIIVYTMKGCPFCVELKDMLIKEGIDFVDRDIHEYEEEYNLEGIHTPFDKPKDTSDWVEKDKKEYKLWLENYLNQFSME